MNYYDAINDNLPLVNEEEIDANLISLAKMNELVIASVDKPIIGTYSLATCIGILLKDDLENAMFIHLDDDFTLSLNSLIKFKGNITPIIIPGAYTREEKVESLKKFLEQYKRFNKPQVMNASSFMTIKDDYSCIDIAYDTRTKRFIKPNIEELLKNEGREQNGRN